MSYTNSKAVVLGGGTAGWLTALFLQRNWPKLQIQVVEDPKRPPIIAGESGTTTFVSLLKHLRIDVNEFIKNVNATPKLAGRFTDWNGEGTEFVHVLQTDHAPWLDGWTDYIESVDEPLNIGTLYNILNQERAKDVYLKTIIANDIPVERAFYAGAFVREEKVPFGATSDLPCVPMWHFESRSTAAYFKQIAISRGIELVEGEYQHAMQDDNGNIVSITLDGDRKMDADWFFDCSGFAQLLLGKVIGEKIVDYSDYFPGRAVVAWWDESKPSVCTNATAMKYGWSWNINLQHRSGNGYLYDPDHLTLDQALDEARQRFGEHIEPVANFNFTPGVMRTAWRNNVVAIGLSTGFLEPLEANGVYVIIESLYALQDHWKPFEKEQRPESVKRWNDRVWQITEDVRDFLALHYRGHRRDTDFWLSHAHDKCRVPDTLSEKLEQWKQWYYNRGPEPYFNGYSHTAWLMVLQGLKIFDHTKLAEQNQAVLDVGKTVLSINENKYKEMVEPFWTLDQWLSHTAK
jgi:tryptophan halogenase